jgi:hypothetical protein
MWYDHETTKAWHQHIQLQLDIGLSYQHTTDAKHWCATRVCCLALYFTPVVLNWSGLGTHIFHGHYVSTHFYLNQANLCHQTFFQCAYLLYH